MKVFVYEFVTGGGCAGTPLPPFLADGELMWRALLDDLIAIPGVEAITLRDERLARPRLAGARIVATRASTFAADFRACLEDADAVWSVAPESGGILEAIATEVLAAGKRLLGSRPGGVRVAASKTATARRLAEYGVAAIPCYTSPHFMEEECAVVMKPDDGAGCQDTLLFASVAKAQAWSRQHATGGCIFQPYVAGDALSLSLLCADGQAQLLSVNRQVVEARDGRFGFHGVTVNALADLDGRFADLASQVAAAIPELWGYVGIDLIAGTAAPPIVVEVNPRPTVSYAGLRAALDCNPAQRLLDLPAFTPCQGRRAVHLETDHAH
ncbi:MAG: ATP-grasp domain-containing protein [Pseudomonadota bacterium]